VKAMHNITNHRDMFNNQQVIPIAHCCIFIIRSDKKTRLNAKTSKAQRIIRIAGTLLNLFSKKKPSSFDNAVFD
tara:strand:+ start:1728 stop:1949 length:222 start_codon:yes stop_codon:yes gene_type:complete